jgi:pimeloyl-ACP methyl ester carboxylesterase
LVPTLVLHRRLDRAVRIEAGRYVASHIQGARFIELEGDDHWFFAGAQEPVIEAIRRFVADLRPGHSRVSKGVSSTGDEAASV